MKLPIIEGEIYSIYPSLSETHSIVQETTIVDVCVSQLVYLARWGSFEGAACLDVNGGRSESSRLQSSSQLSASIPVIHRKGAVGASDLVIMPKCRWVWEYPRILNRYTSVQYNVIGISVA